MGDRNALSVFVGWIVVLTVLLGPWVVTAWTWMCVAGNLHHLGLPIPAIGFRDALRVTMPLAVLYYMGLVVRALTKMMFNSK
jgi:hypothetical protein